MDFQWHAAVQSVVFVLRKGTGHTMFSRIIVMHLPSANGLPAGSVSGRIVDWGKRLRTANGFAHTFYCRCLQAREHNPPDVWIQLLRTLLKDAACRQALLQRSTAAAAAAPAELLLAQLAASLAEELAARQ